MTVLAMFNELEVPTMICKLSIISILLIPHYLRARHPQYLISRWIYVCYWYSIRYWDMFSNEHFFRNKSFLFCWLHSAAMRNMRKAAACRASFNVSVLLMSVAHLIFVVLIHPYL